MLLKTIYMQSKNYFIFKLQKQLLNTKLICTNNQYLLFRIPTASNT
jgi:hypothetical protein